MGYSGGKITEILNSDKTGYGAGKSSIIAIGSYEIRDI